MEVFTVEDLSFTYPLKNTKALNNVNLTISKGEFVLVCGSSGCGKTTLLRLLKPLVAPHGERQGKIYFEGASLEETDERRQAAEIGFVSQIPDNQSVTDKVWHELAFALEGLGMQQEKMRTRVAEMAAFFGIEDWFHRLTNELSGGQKQLLNLASVMAAQPSVLILDEPTSQLDPIAAQEFLNNLVKINRELGTTIILSEHRLEEALPLANRVVVMDLGEVIADTTPDRVGGLLKRLNSDMYISLPTPIRVYNALSGEGETSPVTVREGRLWLEEYSKVTPAVRLNLSEESAAFTDTAIEIREVFFRYERDSADILKGLTLKVGKGELFALVGGNGVGKSTALSVMAGINIPYRGKVTVNGRKIFGDTHPEGVSMLPQDPRCLFIKKTVKEDLKDIIKDKGYNDEEADRRIREISALCRIEGLENYHPYDLSGGEQQRVALAKVLLTDPDILLLDEPTKGMDSRFKEEFASIMDELKAREVTIVMVSHDIEFCAKYADRCGMLFDGALTATGTPRDLFSANSFYTTAACRMARGVIPKVLLSEDIIKSFAG